MRYVTYILVILMFVLNTSPLWAQREIDADQIKSSDRTKTWVMPSASGTLETEAQIQAELDALEAALEADIADVAAGALNTANDLVTHANLTTTVHGIADTADLLTTTNTKAVTNKDIDGGTASNSNRITVPKNTKANLDGLTRKEATIVFATDEDKAYIDNGAELVPVGSGSGGLNFVTNPDAESATTGWSTFADGASGYVDGTGGSPTGVLSRDTGGTIGNTLNGNGSFAYVAGGIGDGVTVDVDITFGYAGAVLELSFPYIISNSSVFTEGDMKLRAYDVDTGEILYAIDGENLAKTQEDVVIHKARFAIPGWGPFNGNVRVSLYQATAATGYTVLWDDVAFGPQHTPRGPPVSPITNYGTITLGATTTAPAKGVIVTDEVTGYQNGPEAILTYKYHHSTAGTAGSGDYLFSLPAGMSFDTTYITPSTAGIAGNGNDPAMQKAYVGAGHIGVTAGSRGSITCFAYDTTRFRCTVGNVYTSYTMWSAATFSWANANLGFAIDIRAPIAGWTSSGNISTSTSSGRLIAARVTSGASTSVTANTTISLTTPTVEYNYGGAYNAGSFTCPERGLYLVRAESIYFNNGTYLYLYKNGTINRYILQGLTSNVTQGETEILCDVGDVLTIRPSATTTLIYSAGAYAGAFTFKKLNTPQQMYNDGQICSAAYSLSANFATNTTTPVNYDTKLHDQCNSVTTGATTWKYTASSNGMYQVCPVNYSATGIGMLLYKNGTLNRPLATATSGGQSGNCTDIQLRAGDYVDVRGSVAGTIGGGTISGGSGLIANISIKRVGNY